MALASGDCDLEEVPVGEVGVVPVGACFGGWMVGMRFVRV